MLLAALVVLAVIFVVAVVVLRAPIDLELAANRDPELQWHVQISWMYGQVTKELHPGKRGARPLATRTRRSRVARKRSWSVLHRIAQSEGVVPCVALFLRRLVAGIELRGAEVWARAGFDDPADTGRFLGILFPLTHYLAAVTPFHVDIEPDFLREGLVFRARGHFRLVPSRIIGPTVAFFLSPPILKGILLARA